MEYLSGLSIIVVITLLANGVGWFWLKSRLEKSIQHEYNKKFEAHKASIALSLDKRKRLYEGKLDNYRKYLQYLDTYSEQGRKEIFVALNSMFEKMMTMDTESPEFAKIPLEILPIMEKVSDDFLHLKNEIQGLRLEAGEKLLSLLDEYVFILGKQNDEYTQMIQAAFGDFGNYQQVLQDFSVSQQNSELNIRAGEVHNAIFNEMRIELDII